MIITDTSCTMCQTAQESTTHLLSACSNIAQTLYIARDDRMLRSIYNCLLNSTISRKVTMESHGSNRAYRTQNSAWKKREGKDIFGNVPFIFEKPPENGAYKPVVIVHDKETNICSVFEGTVCKVDKIAEQFKEKQAKCIDLCAGIKREHRSTSVYQYGLWLSWRTPWTIENLEPIHRGPRLLTLIFNYGHAANDCLGSTGRSDNNKLFRNHHHV